MADILEALEWYVGFNERLALADAESKKTTSEAERLNAAVYSTVASRIANLFEELTGERPATERR